MTQHRDEWPQTMVLASLARDFGRVERLWAEHVKGPDDVLLGVGPGV